MLYLMRPRTILPHVPAGVHVTRAKLTDLPRSAAAEQLQLDHRGHLPVQQRQHRVHVGLIDRQHGREFNGFAATDPQSRDGAQAMMHARRHQFVFHRPLEEPFEATDPAVDTVAAQLAGNQHFPQRLSV